MSGYLSEDGGEDRNDETDNNQKRKISGEEKCRGGRNNKHRNDNDGTNCLEGGNSRNGDHSHEQVVHDLRAEALGLGEAGIKRGNFEFFVEKGNDQGIKKESCPDDQGGMGNREE